MSVFESNKTYASSFYKGLSVRNQTLDNVTVNHGKIHNLSFVNTVLNGWKCSSFTMDQTFWSQCSILDGTFDQCYFSRVNDMQQCYLERTKFDKCSGTLVLDGTHFSDCSFNNSRMTWIWRNQSSMHKSDCSSLTLARASFQDTNPWKLFVTSQNQWRGMVIEQLDNTDFVTQLTMLYAGIRINNGLFPVLHFFSASRKR